MGKALQAFLKIDGIGSPFNFETWEELSNDFSALGFKKIAKLIKRNEGEVIYGIELLGCEKEITSLHYLLWEDLRAKKDISEGRQSLIHFLYTYLQLAKTYDTLLTKKFTPVGIDPIMLRFI